METRELQHNPEPEKNKKFNWWQTTLLLVSTLVISLFAGYFVSAKYLWDDNTDTKKVKEQIEYYEDQVNEKPNDPKMRVQLGFSYFLMKDYDEAIKEYKTAVSLDKNYFDAYLNLAIIYDKLDRSEEALQNATKAAKISPKDYKGHFIKGKSFRKLKMYKEANEALAEAERLNPGNIDTIYEIGLVAEKQGKKKEAEAIYKDALNYDPLYKPAIEALDRLADKK